MRWMLAVVAALSAACSGGSDDSEVDAMYAAPLLGARCDAATNCGERATCEAGVCTIACDSSNDCPQFAVCTDGPGAVRGCFWFCNSPDDCPTTTPTCSGTGFGHCEE